MQASLCHDEFVVAFNLFTFPSDASFSLRGLLDDATNFQLSLWGGELGVTFCGVSFCCLWLAHVQVAAGVQSP